MRASAPVITGKGPPQAPSMPPLPPIFNVDLLQTNYGAAGPAADGLPPPPLKLVVKFKPGVTLATVQGVCSPQQGSTFVAECQQEPTALLPVSSHGMLCWQLDCHVLDKTSCGQLCMCPLVHVGITGAWLVAAVTAAMVQCTYRRTLLVALLTHLFARNKAAFPTWAAQSLNRPITGTCLALPRFQCVRQGKTGPTACKKV